MNLVSKSLQIIAGGKVQLVGFILGYPLQQLPSCRAMKGFSKCRSPKLKTTHSLRRSMPESIDAGPHSTDEALLH